MYVTLRRYAEVGVRMYGMIARKVEDGLVPALKGQPGFRCYCAFVSEDGDGVPVTAFDDRERAVLADGQVRAWVRDNLRDLVPDPPEVSAGQCGVAEVARERSAGQRQPPFVVVREYADLGPAEETGEVVRRHAPPIIAGSPGFRAVYAFGDERDPSRGAIVTLFDTRTDALRSHERSARVFREEAGGVAPSPPRVASRGGRSSSPRPTRPRAGRSRARRDHARDRSRAAGTGCGPAHSPWPPTLGGGGRGRRRGRARARSARGSPGRPPRPA